MLNFKIRCSAIGQIMTDGRSKTEPLGQTCKSYLDIWMKEQLYDRQQSFSSKYTEKGLSCEDGAIEFLADHFDLGLISKNEKHYTNEFLTGTPDLVLSDSVRDIKCPFSWATFPLLATEIPTKDYMWQLQGYMALTGKDRAALHYCLMDAPDSIIEREARSKAYQLGMLEVDSELYDQIAADHTYSHLPDALRLKSFWIDRDEELIQKVYKRVEECRTYVEQAMEQNGLYKLLNQAA